jgi:hypothetical protein
LRYLATGRDGADVGAANDDAGPTSVTASDGPGVDGAEAGAVDDDAGANTSDSGETATVSERAAAGGVLMPQGRRQARAVFWLSEVPSWQHVLPTSTQSAPVSTPSQSELAAQEGTQTPPE